MACSDYLSRTERTVLIACPIIETEKESGGAEINHYEYFIILSASQLSHIICRQKNAAPKMKIMTFQRRLHSPNYKL